MNRGIRFGYAAYYQYGQFGSKAKSFEELSKGLHHHFYLLSKVIIQVQTGLEYSAG